MKMIDHLIALGGESYAGLWDRCRIIDAEVEKTLLPPVPPSKKDEYTLPFGELDRNDVNRVGGKSAQLGEMLSQLGLPIPQGFCHYGLGPISIFIDSNNLQETNCRKDNGSGYPRFGRSGADRQRHPSFDRSQFPVPDDFIRRNL